MNTIVRRQRPGRHIRNRWHGRALFASFCQQTKAIARATPDTVLEIGLGSGITTWYLRERGIQVTTADINEELEPDVVADVTELPFLPNSFDVACAFEVLEHLPFERFPKALGELRRVATRRVILSLPDAGRSCYVGLRAPLLKPRHWLIPLHRVLPRLGRGGPTEEEHYWEINLRGFPLRRVVSTIEHAGLEIVRTWRVPEYAYHRFFELAPID